MSEELQELPLGALWERVAEGGPGMGGGAVAAATAATAASLVEMVARASVDMWPEAADVAGQAQALRMWATQLAQVNMDTYGAAKEALASAYAGQGETDSLKDTLGVAMEVPLRIAELADDVAELANQAAQAGDYDLRPDAAVAAALAAASTRAAAHLVAINLTATADDPRIAVARAAAEDAEAQARAALREDEEE
jgi:formiminotetrahydrofolate cyclodeaminase